MKLNREQKARIRKRVAIVVSDLGATDFCVDLLNDDPNDGEVFENQHAALCDYLVDLSARIAPLVDREDET